MDAFKLQCSNIVKVESVVKAEIVPGLKDTAPQCREILPGGGGGYFRNFWVGMCRWDPGTLNLYQS